MTGGKHEAHGEPRTGNGYWGGKKPKMKEISQRNRKGILIAAARKLWGKER